MAANKPGWPNCGCTERCKKPKCNRQGSRALAKEANSSAVLQDVAVGLLSRRDTQKTLKRILKAARRTYVLADIRRQCGVGRTLIQYWLLLSRKGRRGDFFDIELGGGRIERFHTMFEDACEEAMDHVDQKALNLATGIEKEILTNQQGVIYKYDPVLLALGLTGEAAYLLDEDGDPIPQTVPMLDAEMVRWLLSRRRPKQYGNRMHVEHEHKGGVLVVGVTKNSNELEASYSKIKNTEIEDVEFDEIDPETPSEAAS